jgi:hypothetical protein
MQNVCIFIFREGFTENALGDSWMNMQHSQWSLAPGSSVAVEQRRRSNGAYCTTAWLRAAWGRVDRPWARDGHDRAVVPMGVPSLAAEKISGRAGWEQGR